jgi:hypothetical protein
MSVVGSAKETEGVADVVEKDEEDEDGGGGGGGGESRGVS